ncbi:RNA 2',3'-cyclic phosphodiesterase [Candidatus Methylacidithermus pantelleriae]|uniref:RNA 2',3'-cyclic phosphodiesterase n=1 Tax=Candidatus Methylacidithermus pantelleriae TaxID=2744239 RepID=A0A8J2BRX7_9BACT|nr:RNA 2',3'-cyclic phosphodiesterase [Candidatus Methylacidithermus pantelleriae]CAF0702710.1 RNA 2\\',3\\'-cyclic phosphodiesterase [Candidatus Methylacidithermus pantelleriae]
MQNALENESAFLRLFFAIPLAQATRESLESLLGHWSIHIPQIRWVNPSQLHITLHFLGKTPSTSLPLLREVLEQTAQTHSAFWACLGPLEAFPNRTNPRVLWVSLKKGAGEIQELVGTLTRLLVERGLSTREERTFVAHVTIGRIRAAVPRPMIRQLLEQPLCPEPSPFFVDRITLFSSTLTPTGPIYRAINEARLSPPTSTEPKC